MSAADEPLERLGALLAELADEDAPAVLAAAREGARARAREALEGALLEALLQRSEQLLGDERGQLRTGRQTASRRRPVVETEQARGAEGEEGPEPPAGSGATSDDADVATGLWVYAVVGEREDLPEGIEGVEPRFRTKLIWDRGTGAVVSAVPLEEYGDEHLKERLADVDWLEEKARAHERVVEGALAGGVTVPMRLCTIFSNEQRVREMLADQRDLLLDSLARLDGKAEWGVKVFLDPAAAATGAGADEPGGGPGSGGSAYMAERSRERAASEEAQRLADECADECHRAVAELAEEAIANPLQRPEVTGHPGEMILNGAYLVGLDLSERIERTVAELRDRYGHAGADVELTGPWPPYHFVAAPVAPAQ